MDELLEDYKNQKISLVKNGLLKQLTNAIIECALGRPFSLNLSYMALKPQKRESEEHNHQKSDGNGYRNAYQFLSGIIPIKVYYTV